MSLQFTVLGTPIPKGSTRAYLPKGWTRPIITSDNTKVRPWQEAIVVAALDVLGDAPLMKRPTPVALWLRFFMPRPKTAPRRETEATKKPDLDKLVRAVKDALTRAGAYDDDSQVVLVVASKEFAAGARDPDGARGLPRVVIRVDEYVAAAAPTQLRPETYSQGKLWAELEA